MLHPYSDGELTNYGRNGQSAGSRLGMNMSGMNALDSDTPGGDVGEAGGEEKRAYRQSATDDRALEAWASMRDTPRGGDDDHDNTAKDGNGNEKDEGKNNDQERRHPIEKRDRSDTCIIEEELAGLSASTCLPGPKLLCFDGDQTLYSDGKNFEQSPKLAKYLYLLLKHGVTIAVVTAAGYEYQTEKYELRLTGLLAYFKQRGLESKDLERFYIFGGECNYLMRLGNDYKLHAVREDGPGGWMISTKYISTESPGNWSEEEVTSILDMAEECFQTSLKDQNMRARIIRKKRSVGLIPQADEKIPREALDETVLRIQSELENAKITLPFCAL